MMLCFERNTENCFRPLVFIGNPEKPSGATQLVVGSWHNTLRQAQKKGLESYFDTYLDYYGRRHPHDPKVSLDYGKPPVTVFVAKATDAANREVANVAV